MAIYTVEIEGISALLQHRFPETAEVETKTRAVHTRTVTPRDAAESTCYRDQRGRLYHPGSAIMRLLREAGGSHKQRGSRKSLKYIVPAGVLVMEEAIYLHNAAGEPITDFEVDSRPVVIPSTKGRIMCHRARHDKWRMTFTLDIDEDVLDVEVVHQLLEEGGRRLGIGDYRPEKGGPFGRFAVLSWNAQTDRPKRRRRTAD